MGCFISIYYTINLNIVLSLMIFKCLYLIYIYYKFESIILLLLFKNIEKQIQKLD